MHIYRITNSVNQKVYIGKDSSHDHHRWYYHRWAHNKPHVADYDKILYRAMRKHGVENFVYETLIEVESTEELAALETKFIVKHRSTDSRYGYNQRGVPGESQSARNTYRVCSPDGETHDVGHLRDFCRKHDLDPKRMYALAAGAAKAKQWKGWQCVNAGSEFPELGITRNNRKARKGLKHSKQRETNSKTCSWVLVNPDGQEMVIENLKDFCQDNRLHYRSMLRVSSGERPHHKQWRVLSRRSIHEE